MRNVGKCVGGSGRWAGLLAAAVLLQVGCGRELEDWHAPAEPIVPLSVVLGEMRASPLQVTGQGETSAIEVDVRDLEGSPAPGVQVSFTADLGQIVPAGTSDASGVARAVFTAGSTSGLALITASIPGMQRELTLLVGEASLSAVPSTVLADGLETVQLSSSVPGAGTEAAADRHVRFTTTAGTLSASDCVTDANGYVSTMLTSSPSDSDIGATVTLVDALDPDVLLGATLVVFRGVSLSLSAEDTALVADGVSQTTLHATLRETTSGQALGGRSLAFGTTRGMLESPITTTSSGEATSTFTSPISAGDALVTVTYVGGITDTLTIHLSGVGLTLEAGVDTLIADGGATTTITAWLGDPLSGEPRPGEEIEFTSNLGTVDPAAVTNGAGDAVVTLRAGMQSGTCRVTASLRDEVAGQVDVEFVQPTAAGVWLSIDPAVLLADGASQADARAVVALVGGNPVPDGTPVQFTTGAGVIAASATTQSGVATALLTSSANPQMQIPVVARAMGMADTAWVDFVAGEAVEIDVTVSPETLPADGSATAAVTARVRDEVGNSVRDGTVVHFVADRGHVSASDRTADGLAEALFTAATQAGPATVAAEVYTGPVDTLRGYATIELVADSEVADMTLSTDRLSLGVAGVGEIETANITAQLFDKNGNPVPNGVPVTFRIGVGPGGGEYLDTPSVGYGPITVPTAGGVARVGLKSGTESGSVSVEASAGSTVNASARVVIASGPPAHILITVTEGATGVDCLWYKLATALVTDQYSNPVEDSTGVYFTLTDGARAMIEGVSSTGEIPSQSCDYERLWPLLTRTPGAAYSCLVYGSPDVFDTYYVIVRTAGRTGMVADSLLVGNTLIDATLDAMVSPAAVDSAAGGVVDVAAVLRDGCGAYIDDGVIVFTADHPGVFFVPPADVTVGGVAQSQMIAPAGLGKLTIRITARLSGTGITATASVESK